MIITNIEAETAIINYNKLYTNRNKKNNNTDDDTKNDYTILTLTLAAEVNPQTRTPVALEA